MIGPVEPVKEHLPDGAYVHLGSPHSTDGYVHVFCKASGIQLNETFRIRYLIAKEARDSKPYMPLSNPHLDYLVQYFDELSFIGSHGITREVYLRDPHWQALFVIQNS